MLMQHGLIDSSHPFDNFDKLREGAAAVADRSRDV